MNDPATTKTLETLLGEKQIVSDDQIVQAREYSAANGVGFDRALVELNILSAEDLRSIYDDVFQVRFLKLEDVEIDREAARHVPASVAQKYHLIPVRRSGNTLAVAMSDPLNENALNALKSVTDFEIIPFSARYDTIEHAVYLHYGEPEQTDNAKSGERSPVIHSRSLIEDDRVGHIGKGIPQNRNQTFESFVEDESNQFSLRVAQGMIGMRSEESYSPLLCWGPAGCGKTHVLHAMANHLAAHAPLKRFILTTGDRFSENLFESIRDRKVNFFRYLYRELDFLLIDDAESLLHREWAQRELIETLRYLQKKGKHLILASRAELTGEPRILPELRTLLQAGVIAPLTRLSVRARYEILRRRCGSVQLPSEVLDYLANSGSEDMKSGIELLDQVVVMGVMGEREVTIQIVEDLRQLCGMMSASSAAQRARTLYESSLAGRSELSADDKKKL